MSTEQAAKVHAVGIAAMRPGTIGTIGRARSPGTIGTLGTLGRGLPTSRKRRILPAAKGVATMIILALIAAVVAPASSKTMALDDWHSMKILSVGRDASASPP